MKFQQEHIYPQIHYFDSDFVSLYEQSWEKTMASWIPYNQDNTSIPSGYIESDSDTLYFVDVLTSSFFLLYANKSFTPIHALDFFYSKQEENGAIRCAYSKTTGEPVFERGNPEGLAPPYLVWAEFNYYDRTDNKRRLKELIPKIDAYLQWIIDTFRSDENIFVVPHIATNMHNLPRENAHFLLDFNVQMAIAYHYMIKLATATNFRNLVFKYTKEYYTLKAIVNKHFWNAEDMFYYDLDENKNHIKIKTINGFWPLLAQIPNNSQSIALKKHLENPNEFFLENLFPSVAKDSPYYSKKGLGYKGGVYPFLTFMVIKGLTAYGFYEFARESAIKHLSVILANFYAKDPEVSGSFWEAYQPEDFLPAKSPSKNHEIRENFFPSVALTTITLVIENIIGFEICIPKKMVYWTIPHLEFMGIEGLQLKKNMIFTILQQTNRGWEIRHSSEKLYYFSVDILEKEKKKTLPIPSGKCSLLIDKL